MSRSAELEATEPWRKAGFIVRPYHGNDRKDALRFADDYPIALDGIQCGNYDWTHGDVLTGRHEGGSANPIAAAGGAAVVNKKRLQSVLRKRLCQAHVLKHILNDDLKKRLAGAFAANPEGLWADFLATECGGHLSSPSRRP